MKSKIRLIIPLLALLLLTSCKQQQFRIGLGTIDGDLVQTDEGQFIQSASVLADSNEFVWGGSCVLGEDGKYHLFYAMFEAGINKPPFSDSWLLSSKIAHAVSDQPDRDFRFTNIVLYGAAHDGDSTAWDAQGVHNPHIKKFGDHYYLYYIGSRDPGEQATGSPGENVRKRDRIQQVQQTGVIKVAKLQDLIDGHFTRPDAPILSPRTRVKPDHVVDPSPPGTKALPDNMIVVNPSVVFRPSDEKYLLYFKGNFWDPGWRGVHGVAIGDHPDGPFNALDDIMFDVRMPDGKVASAEDPYVWYHKPSDQFYAIFKDFTGRFTGAGKGLAMLVSPDGIEWTPAENPFFSGLEIVLKNGDTIPVRNLERPQLLLDKKGNPLVFYGAVSITPLSGKRDGSTYNIQIPVIHK